MRTLSLLGLALVVIFFLLWSPSEKADSDSVSGPVALASEGQAGQGESIDEELARSNTSSSRVASAVAVGNGGLNPDELTEDAGPGTGNWRGLLDDIRSASMAENPHGQAWYSVQALSSAVGSELRGGEESAIAVHLERLLISPDQESAFVRGAILLALGLAHPSEVAQELALTYMSEPPGELSRAAWLLSKASRLDGIDLARFQPLYSATGCSIWPVTVRPHSDEMTVERALAQLTPPNLYLSALPFEESAEYELAREGFLTREVIVLSCLTGEAQEPGLIREKLLEWTQGTDMSRACIWSLCLAAKDDEELAGRLRNLLMSLGLSTGDGSLLAMLLVDLSGRGELIYDFLELNLTGFYDAGPGLPPKEQLNALFALGEILKSDDLDLVEQTADLLVDVALGPDRTDTLRSLALGQLAAVTPERIPDVLEALLLNPETEEVASMAAILTKFVPSQERQAMRDMLINTYANDLPMTTQDNYAFALVSLGGDDARALLHELLDSGNISEEAEGRVASFLGVADTSR